MPLAEKRGARYVPSGAPTSGVSFVKANGQAGNSTIRQSAFTGRFVGSSTYMSNTSDLYFAWDDNKATQNLRKHDVSFEEATSAFHDAFARVMPDPDHSGAEERFVLLGLSLRARVLVVVHCLRDEGRVIRIISARRATRAEERTYWRYWHAQGI